MKTSLRTNPWVVFLLPFAVYMLAGSLEPTPEKPGGVDVGLAIPYDAYPWVYTVKIVLTVAAVGFVWPGYRRFPLKVSLLALGVGVIGGVVWVGLCRLALEPRMFGPIGLGSFVEMGQRSGYDPFAHLTAHPACAWGFLAIRFLGLVAVVALIEEFFLRGFLMRFVMERDWWDVPLGQATVAAVVAGTVYGMVSHPAELLAAAVWFSMITWLMVRTRNVWDCVAAHAVTNLLLGIYVVHSGDWRLM